MIKAPDFILHLVTLCAVYAQEHSQKTLVSNTQLRKCNNKMV